MKTRWTTAMALAALLLGGTATGARAGWMIQEADPEFPDEVTTYWFQAGKVKVEGALEGLTILVDLKKNEGWLLDAANKKYSGGKIPDLVEQLKKLETEEAAPAEEGEAPPAAPEAPEEQPAAEPEPSAPQTVEVKDLGAGEKILGLETKHYQVFADKEMVEELWVSPKVDVEKEVALASFQDNLQKMLGGGNGMNQGYEDDAAYKKLRASGYTLRQILYFVGEKSTLEVRKAEQKSFPDETFAVPAGLAKVGYVDLLVGESPQTP